MPVQGKDACAQHNLWFAHSPWPSQDGRLVYVICGCGQRRRVEAEAWVQEATRRREAAARRPAPVHGLPTGEG
jgi:hypothetical protein